MFADVMKLPVETVSAGETGALGCAIAAAAATEAYDSVEDAAGHMCRISSAVYPNRDLFEIYDKKYKLYLKTIDCMDGLWDEMNELINLGMLR